ncbi:MAG: sulfotransferase family 2 domain-containing protein [Thermodesulfobacteriota bacterium]
MFFKYLQNNLTPAALIQQFNNARSLTLQTFDYVTGYRLRSYSPFVVFPEFGIAFLAVPRAGSTSLEFSLLPLLGNGLNFQSARYVHKFRHYMRSCKAGEVATTYTNFFKFTFVRNPWTRLYSCYLTRVLNKPNRYFRHFKLDQSKNFEDFVARVCDIPDAYADPHFISQDYLLTYKGVFLPDQVYRFETYSRDFEAVRKIIEDRTRIKLYDIPHYYQMKSDEYVRAYTTKLVDRVEKRYRADCIRFGYVYPG